MNRNIQNMLPKMILAVASLSGSVIRDRNNRADLVTVVTQQLKDMLAAQGDPAAQERAVKLYQEAYKNPEKMAELCGVRLQQSTNYILSSTNFMGSFFEIISLQNNERPYWQNNSLSEVAVYYLGQDGEPRIQKAVQPQEEYPLPLRFLTSAEFEYLLQDIYNGDIRDAAEKTVDIAFDMTNKMDGECKDVLDLIFGNFNTSASNKASRTFVTNSRVKTANLPNSNALDVRSLDGEWILNVIRATVEYCNKWGVNAFKDGALLPTGQVFVPAVDASDLLWSEKMRPEGVTNNKVAEGVMGNYSQFDFAGYTWQLVPDNTLDSGYVYPVLNKRPGQVFLKPGLDQEYEEVMPKKNKVSRYQKKVFSAHIPEHRKPYAVRVRYTPN
jgi:hypothetical protein